MSDADQPTFTVWAYLRDRWSSIAILIACSAATAAMCLILGVSVDGTALVCAFIATMALTAGAVEVARRKRFWEQMSEACALMDRAAQFDSMVGEPGFLEGRIAYDAAERVSDLANAELTGVRADMAAYREYVELWIHEAKAPIAAAQLVLSRMAGEEADALAREVERIEDQVEQALYYARASSVESDYSIREVPLAAACREACKRHARLLIERQAIPHIDIDDGLSVLADKPWLVFIVGQVIVNSARYGAESIIFTAAGRDEGTSRGCTVLTIADDGWGIPAADIDRVFERGFTGSNGRTRGGATGMGLHLVASMCARLGLGVRLISEEGSGTRVELSFPHDRRHAL